MSEELMLCEVFDSDSSKNYPATDLMPKAKIPQMWAIDLPGNKDLIARMLSYGSKGDSIKNLKPGDKYAHVILMSLSEKGNIAELRGGLGSDPVGALNTIFDCVYSTFKSNHMQAVLFRFPAKKMKGQEKAVQRIISRLVAKRGNLEVLDEIYQFTNKHSYILIKKKGIALDSISGIPGIDSDMYTKVDSKVGDVYVCKKTGEKVTKDEAIVASIAEVENKRTDKTVVSRTKISRRELFMAHQSVDTYSTFSLWSQEAKDYYSSLEPLDFTPNSVDNTYDAGSVLEAISSHYGDIEKLNHILRDKKEEFFNILDKVKFNQSYDLIEKIFRFCKSNNIAEIYYVELVDFILNALTEKAIELVNNASSELEFTEEESKAIDFYTSSGYSDINDFLLGRDKYSSIKSLKWQIGGLDSAFSKGKAQPKGTIVYRAQGLEKALLNKVLENKQIYFPNYISTSIAPRPFLLLKDSWQNMDSTFLDTEVNTSEIIESIFKDHIIFVIKGTDTIPTINPGDLTSYQDESEIILPRGTLLKFDKVYSKSKYNILGEVHSSIYVIECHIDNGVLRESTKIPMGRFSKFTPENNSSGIEIYMEAMLENPRPITAKGI